MVLFDCETKESTYYSIEYITGIKAEKINSVLLELNYDQNLYLNFKKRCGLTAINNADYTVWFHMSRVFDQKVFDNGILPINEALEVLKRDLRNFIKTLNMDSLPPAPKELYSRYHNSAICIANRLSNIRLAGPYAILIRDLAFCTVHGKYLEIPETVEDLLIESSVQIEKNLIDVYKDKTKPCIVKFRNREFSERYLDDAIDYLYCIENCIPISTKCGYNGEGTKVMKEDILKVELF